MHYDTTPHGCRYAGHEWGNLIDANGDPMCSRCGHVDADAVADESDSCDYCGADMMDGCWCQSIITGIGPGCSRD